MAQKGGGKQGAYIPTQSSQQEEAKLSVILSHNYQMATIKINKVTGTGEDVETEFLCTTDR